MSEVDIKEHYLRLMLAIFGEGLYDRIDSIIKETLTEREADIIKMRFGLDIESSPDYQSLAKIGLRYGITRERVRQIQERALRKLRWKSGEILRIIRVISEEGSADIDRLGLSANMNKALRRNGIYTVYGLLTKSDSYIPGLGVEAKKKVMQALRNIPWLAGLIPQELELQQFDLCTRTTNTLRRAGIDTVSQLLSRWNRRIPNLGIKARQELVEVLAGANIKIG